MDGNGKISNVDNGDRFVYAQADILKPLPSSVNIGNHVCRIFHKKQLVKCARCSKNDHMPFETAKCKTYIH